MTDDNSVDNVEVDVRRGYYESGDLSGETPYVNGKKNGIAKYYFESGALCQETPFVNGVTHGIHKTYNKDSENINGLRLYEVGHRVASIDSIYKEINHVYD
jgi:antitoxin component YwqK of YwqJK toxin-antitoxin module